MKLIQKYTDASNNAESTSVVVSVGAPGGFGGSSYETLDFSLPSYTEATKGSSSDSGSTKSAPPSFTASFPELKVPESIGTAAPAPAPAVDTEAQKKAAEEDKAAKQKVNNL